LTYQREGDGPDELLPRGSEGKGRDSGHEGVGAEGEQVAPVTQGLDVGDAGVAVVVRLAEGREELPQVDEVRLQGQVLGGA
jgi:hypothetical protein